MEAYMVSVIILFVCILIARVVSEKGNKKLTAEKKAELIDLFSQSRIYSMVLMIGFLGAFFINIKYELLDIFYGLILFVIAICLFTVGSTVWAYGILKKNDFPEEYIKSFLLSTAIRVVGIFVLLLFMFI